jgi:IS5 family transposase
LTASSIQNIHLYLLARVITWEKIEEAFAPLYGKVGLPSHPIRKMAALLMLKHSTT